MLGQTDNAPAAFALAGTNQLLVFPFCGQLKFYLMNYVSKSNIFLYCLIMLQTIALGPSGPKDSNSVLVLKIGSG